MCAKRFMRYNPLELCKINSKYGAKLSQNLKSELGRMGLLRTTAWQCNIRLLRGKRKRCARKQKRGKRAGLLAKLKANNNRLVIPSLFFSQCSGVGQQNGFIKVAN